MQTFLFAHRCQRSSMFVYVFAKTVHIRVVSYLNGLLKDLDKAVSFFHDPHGLSLTDTAVIG